MQNQRSVLPSMLALPRGGTTAPTTPLLRFMIAYAQPKVNMRAKLLPYANRKADTETAAQAVRCARTAQAVRPVRAGSFAVNHSGELPLRAAGAQEGRQPAVFHPLVNLPFSLLPWVQTVDCVSVEKRERQRIFSSALYNTYSHFAAVSSLPLPPCPRRKGRSSKRKGNHGCPFLFAPAASAAVPRCATAHSSPRNGEPFTRFGHTGKSVPRNLRSKSARRSTPPTFSLVQCRKMRYTYFI